MSNRSLGALLLMAAGLASPIAGAQEPIKVGMILEMSGPFADLGRQILAGAQAYMKAHGETVAGRKVELILPARKPWRSLTPEQLDLIESIARGGDWPTVISRIDADDVALTQAAIDLQKHGVIDY